MMKLLIALMLVLAVAYASSPSCGVAGYVGPSDCLCAAFNQYSNDNAGTVSCTVGTGSCNNTDLFLPAGTPTQLYTKVRSMGFEVQSGKSYLVIHVEYQSIPTALTDVILQTKGGDFLLSLKEYVTSGASAYGESWIQYLDNSNADYCTNVAAVSIPWYGFAPAVEINDGTNGLFEFDIVTKAAVQIEESEIVIRDYVRQACITDTNPILIKFNFTVNTKEEHFHVTNFTLAFDINVKYFLKSAYLDPLTLNLTVIVQHNISFPLNLVSQNLVVLFNGQAVPQYLFDTYVSCDDNDAWTGPNRGPSCEGLTTIVASLPPNANCTNNQVNVSFDLVATCDPGHYNASSTLCPSVLASLTTTTVPVFIPFTYNFCPKLISTEVSVASFTLNQNGQNIPEYGEINIHYTVNGTIILHVDSRVNGSVLYYAKITNIKILETVPLNDGRSLPYLDVSAPVSTVKYGSYIGNHQIEVTYNYQPNYDLITTYLQQWANGIYFQVTIDVALTAPGVPGTRKVKSQTFKTVAKLALSGSDILALNKAEGKSNSFTLNKIQVEQAIKDKKASKLPSLPQPASTNNKDNEQLSLVREKNEKMVVAAVASVGGALLVAVVALVVVVSVMLKKRN